MIVAISGSSSALAQEVIPILINKFDAHIVSIGRNHHELARLRIDWELGDPLSNIPEGCSFFFHFAYSRFDKRIGGNLNLRSLETIFVSLPTATTLVLPASYSSDAIGRSHYARVKSEQESLCQSLGGILFRVGYLWKNAGVVSKKFDLIKIISKFPIAVLPSKKLRPIKLTTQESLMDGIANLIRSKSSFECQTTNVDFLQLLNMHNERKRIVLRIPIFMIVLLNRIIGILPGDKTFALSDSLMSLIPRSQP